MSLGPLLCFFAKFVEKEKFGKGGDNCCKPVLPEGGEEEEEGEEDDEKASARSIRMPERQEEKERLLNSSVQPD